MSDIIQILSTLIFSSVSHVTTPIEPFFHPPAFVIVSRDKMSDDSITPGIVVHYVLNLIVNPSADCRGTVDPGHITVRHIARMKHRGNSFPSKQVILTMKSVQ